MGDVSEMPESLHSLSFEDHSVDSEAQLVVTDFLDYTEYLPSDIIRSFTLIRQLDKAYTDAAAKVHDLTRQYGKLPELPIAQRPDVNKIRHDISSALDKALNCRQAAAAEANRINEVVKRHQIRLGLIKTKLQALPKPPSRDPTPPPSSPVLSKSNKAEEAVKLTVQEKRRKRKGLVLEDIPPADVDVDVWNEHEEEELAISPKNARSEPKPASARTPKTPSLTRSRVPKTPKERRTGEDGQPLHHRVSVISTSNALALLTPPPENALPGSKWRPWLKLTEYELAVIRKTMKKNVSWVPSSAMITRYLSAHERGPENYQIAKAIAESSGLPLLDEEPESKDLAALSGRPDDAAGSSSPGSQLENESQQLVGTGANGNDDIEMTDVPLVLPSQEEEKAIVDYFTTAHRPRTRRATQDAMPMDEINKKINEVSQSMKTIFDQPPATPSVTNETASNTTRKRKRGAAKDSSLDSPSVVDTKHDNKRLRTSRAEPSIVAIISPTTVIPEVTVVSTTTVVPTAPEALSPAITFAAPKDKEVESVEIIPSRRKSTEGLSISATAAQFRPKRNSVLPKDTVVVDMEPSSQLDVPRASRSSTRSGEHTSVKAASVEPPPSRREKREPRRFSGNDESIPAAPAAPPTNPRPSRRRPLPGVVAAEDGSKDNVSIGPQRSKPKSGKKIDATKTVDEEVQEVQYQDPDEPTYCICNDVSYGVMIACENEKCEKEWFHLECINLTEIPPRRTKWYCPLCRDKLHIDEKGNAAPVVTGRRK